MSEAKVEVDGQTVGEIGAGLLILLGIHRGDETPDADYLVRKTLGLRIFPDEQGKMNKNVLETGGSLLVVSQFTLYGDCSKGNRPAWDAAARPEKAKELYEYFVGKARESGILVETGIFQAFMRLKFVNDGPVTIICESRKDLTNLIL